MIRLPHRSVTRFFIPLIDVLLLLFCIYLLLPIVRPPEAGGTGEGGTLGAREREELERLRQGQPPQGGSLAESERRELERIRKEKIEALQQRLAIRVLEIDADTGRLYSYDPERVEIRNEAEAQALIERQRRAARGRDLYYLILYPRQAERPYPTERQKTQYDRWFEGVPHSFDNLRTER
jgi:hypothetical protein